MKTNNHNTDTYKNKHQKNLFNLYKINATQITSLHKINSLLKLTTSILKKHIYTIKSINPLYILFITSLQH